MDTSTEGNQQLHNHNQIELAPLAPSAPYNINHNALPNDKGVQIKCFLKYSTVYHIISSLLLLYCTIVSTYLLFQNTVTSNGSECVCDDNNIDSNQDVVTVPTTNPTKYPTSYPSIYPTINPTMSNFCPCNETTVNGEPLSTEYFTTTSASSSIY